MKESETAEPLITGGKACGEVFMGDKPAAPTLSLCMIVKNEENNLPRCLASVRGVVDELIVVDTGSQDATISIAEQYGAKILHHVWQNDFSLARNIGLAQAVCDWIMYVDADEELEADTRKRLRAVIAGSDAEGIMVTVRNFNPPEALASYHDSPQVRIFRNRPHYRFEQSVHNQISPSILRTGGKLVEETSLIWLHYGYMDQTVQGGDDRLRRSLVMLEEAVNRDPQNAYLSAKLGGIYFHLKEYSLAYAYCHRVLTEMDTNTLGRELMKDVVRVLSYVSSMRGHYQLAIDSARACEELSGSDVDGQTSALDLYGQTYGLWGEDYLRKAVEMESAPDWRERLGTWREHMESARTMLIQSRDAFKRLFMHPALYPQRQEGIQQSIQHCDDLVAYISGRLKKEEGKTDSAA